MANVLSLAMRISADATGVRQQLTPVERALQQLDAETTKVSDVFKEFAGQSDAATKAQLAAKDASDALVASLRSGAINGEQFAAEFAKLGQSVNEQAAAFRRAAQITEANITPQQRYNRTVSELREQVSAGRITQETFNRAMERAKNDLDKAGSSAKKTGSEVSGLARSMSTIAAIEIGRVVVDGFQAIGSVFTRVSSQITSLVTSVNSSIDTLNDFSARTGIGVEALQGYSLAAKLAGVDAEAFGVAVQKLGVNIGKANPGDAFDKSLRGIGLSVAELKALAPEQQFAAIGDAISQLPTAADRAAAAVQVFGKQGAALAPLFREGAASIEELRDRAERLGIIVSETQVNNVADMNDAFDLVSATVQGITGQVIGNLAPAVTAVVDEFLKFVEEFSGTQGTGGTGIANAITDVLLNGAEIFAGVFDQFVGNFGGFTDALKTTSEVFSVAGKLLVTGMEAFRTVFNLIQIGIDALLIGFGKLLEGIGSWVSSDLEQFGAGLAAASEESAKKNSAEMEAAAANAANSFASIFDSVGGNAEQAGDGAASQFVAGIRQRVESERAPEFQIETNIENTRERFDNFFGGIVDQQSVITQSMREYEAAVASVVDPTNMTADEMERIQAAQEKVNSLLDQELASRQEAAEAAAKQAEEDGKIIDSLLKTSDATAQVEQRLAAVARERERLAGQAGEDAQARIQQLDQVQQQLEEQQQALDQGFGESFQKAFEAGNNALDTAIEKSAEFGQAGFDAAQQLAEGINAAQEQAEAGILNKEAYDAEVARQQQLFDQRIANERKVLDERRKADEEATKLRLQQEQTVNDLIAQQQFGGDTSRIKAAENLVAIEAEIARAQEAQAAARQAGDQEALKAATQRLAQLDQVQAKERDIATGLAKQREEAQKTILKQQEDAAKQQQQQQQQILQEQARLAEERRKAEEAEFQRQEKRIRELNTVGSRTVQTADVRTQEGAALVLNLAANAQDPRLIAQRQTNKILQKISTGLNENLNRIGIRTQIVS